MGNSCSRKKNKKSSPSTAEHRDWSSLPNDLLFCILDRLFSFPDVSTFSAVCRSWRSLSRCPSRRPPLLLRPIAQVDFYSVQWTGTPRCRLDSFIPDSPSHFSRLPPAILTQFYIGFAFGHLIFLRSRTTIIADLCTGYQIRPPDLLFDATRRFYYGFLTAPPSSTECRLLLADSGSTLLSWQVGSREWVRHQLGRLFLKPSQILPFRGLLTYRGKLLALDFSGRLIALHFTPQLSIDLWENPQFRPFTNYRSTEYLVECGGNLLRIRFHSLNWTLDPKPMEVYKLESSLDQTTIASWVKVESLGDWCLFLDVRGRSAMACSEPERWGGSSNSVYVIGTGCDHWAELSLQGDPYDYSLPESPFRFGKRGLPRWPAPFWIYPSMMF